MSEIDDLTFEQIATGLRAWARGLYPAEAAVELLLAHRGWLHRLDFTRTVLWVSDDGPGCIGIDWAAAAELARRAPAAGSEAAMLQVAVGLAGHVLEQPLGDLLSRLDQVNTTIVLHAIARTAGWHERGKVALVTGGFAALTPA
ncbi:hypothetical protein [Cellulomonas fimi]|uniref:Uncharacterized protein n=1 Tax=Cellulomonas fimi TaxID=1708 RepID=A0A7Y0QJA5_CELFI|nr:hypothetical protein [Cellulomonas fimi]NMR21152.1 hypothetical protein [Cellulomonas fimi]